MPVPGLACAAMAAVERARPSATTVAMPRRAVLAIALLRPGIAVVMIAALLPEPGAVGGQELDAPDPFGALPEIKPRHDRPKRAGMLARQRMALPGMREQHALGIEFGQRQVGRVVVMPVEDDGARLGLRANGRKDMLGADALKGIVETRPGGDAVNVGDIAEQRLGAERGPIPGHWVLDQAVDGELPALGGHVGLDAEIEHRPVRDLALPRRQPFLRPARRAAGEETAFAGPALPALEELAPHVGERLVFSSDMPSSVTRSITATIRRGQHVSPRARFLGWALPRAV